MAHFEGEIPTMVYGGGSNGSGMWGSDGIWAILLLALLGRGGFGGYGGGYGSTSEGAFGWQLGRLATTNDVASGLSTSEIMSDLNDILLGQTQGFAGVQQTLCQGFNGLNTAILQSANATERGFAQMGYNLADCCCKTQRAIDGVNYNMATNTSAIIQAINNGNQRLVDIYTNDKIDTLNRKLATAEAQLSNNAQSRYIVDTVLDKLSPCPKPAYLTCNPNAPYTPQQLFGCGCNSIQ